MTSNIDPAVDRFVNQRCYFYLQTLKNQFNIDQITTEEADLKIDENSSLLFTVGSTLLMKVTRDGSLYINTIILNGVNIIDMFTDSTYAIEALKARMTTAEFNITTLLNRTQNMTAVTGNTTFVGNITVDGNIISPTIDTINNDIASLKQKTTDISYTDHTIVNNSLETPTLVADELISPTINNLNERIDAIVQHDDHFRGYYETNAEIQSLTAVNGDYAWSGESVTVWTYFDTWSDSLKPIPTGPLPSDDYPKMNGTSTPGTSNNYSRGDHEHPSDTTKANDNAVVHNTGDETINGVKTFVNLPESSVTPTTDNQLVNKNYLSYYVRNDIDLDIGIIDDGIGTQKPSNAKTVASKVGISSTVPDFYNKTGNYTGINSQPAAYSLQIVDGNGELSSVTVNRDNNIYAHPDPTETYRWGIRGANIPFNQIKNMNFNASDLNNFKCLLLLHDKWPYSAIYNKLITVQVPPVTNDWNTFPFHTQDEFVEKVRTLPKNTPPTSAIALNNANKTLLNTQNYHTYYLTEDIILTNEISGSIYSTVYGNGYAFILTYANYFTTNFDYVYDAIFINSGNGLMNIALNRGFNCIFYKMWGRINVTRTLFNSIVLNHRNGYAIVSTTEAAIHRNIGYDLIFNDQFCNGSFINSEYYLSSVIGNMCACTVTNIVGGNINKGPIANSLGYTSANIVITPTIKIETTLPNIIASAISGFTVNFSLVYKCNFTKAYAYTDEVSAIYMNNPSENTNAVYGCIVSDSVYPCYDIYNRGMGDIMNSFSLRNPRTDGRCPILASNYIRACWIDGNASIGFMSNIYSIGLQQSIATNVTQLIGFASVTNTQLYSGSLYPNYIFQSNALNNPGGLMTFFLNPSSGSLAYNKNAPNDLVVNGYSYTFPGIDGRLCTIDMIYPVGSVMLRMDSLDPGTIPGMTHTKWTRINTGYLLAGTSPLSTGGSSTSGSTALSKSQIPSHTHTATTDSAGSHSHSVGMDVNNTSEVVGYAAKRVYYYAASDRSQGWRRATNESLSMASAGEHTHTITVNSTGSGSGHTHTINPPYITVAMWYRIS